MRKSMYLVTLRHKQTGEYRTTRPRLTAAWAAEMLAEVSREGHFEPNAPNTNFVEELPVDFATRAAVVNVERFQAH